MSEKGTFTAEMTEPIVGHELWEPLKEGLNESEYRRPMGNKVI